MPRILPDAHDQIIWLLNEQSGNYQNTGSFLPGNATTSLAITNTIIRSGTGLFPGAAIQLPGTTNIPTGSSATRNYASGANTVNITPPITLSCWANLRSYTTNNNSHFIAKEYRDPNLSGNSWVAPFQAINLTTLTTNGGGDWAAAIAINSTTNVNFTVTDFPIPLGTWSHIGMTYDGTNIRAYLNGCQMMNNGNPTALTLAAAQLSYTDGTNGFGPWRVGAITSTGSGNKEECNAQVTDVRIANVVRPLSYFQKVYSAGVLPLPPGGYANTQFYKLRAYDLGCSTPTSVVWIDTQVSLANAPAFPCSGPYSPPEVLETWFQ